MAVYAGDHTEWVAKSIQSILLQDYQDFVLIIVVDGSIDADLNALVEHTEATNENVLVLQKSDNTGLSQSMNLAIDESIARWPNAKFFFRMDADDISESNRLSKQVAFLEENPEVSVLGSSLVEIDENDRVVGQRLLPLKHEQIYRVLPRRCALNHPTVAIRMSVFKQGFRYRSDLMNTQDYFLWIELCSNGIVFANLPDELLRFRRVNNFYKRRGLSKSLNEFKARFYAMRQLKSHSFLNVVYAFSVILLRVMPPQVIKLAYKIDRYFLNRK